MDAMVNTNIIKVVLRNGCGEVNVEYDRIPEGTQLRDILAAGLDALINKVGMSKKLPGISKLTGAEKERAIADVLKQAQQNVEAIYAGTLSSRKAKGKKADNAVETEALRLAKVMTKEAIKASGQRVGAYTSKEQTEYAKRILETYRDTLIVQAEKNLAERAKLTEGLTAPSLESVFGAKALDPANKAKPRNTSGLKKKGETISATQAGMVAPRKGQAPQAGTRH